MKPLAEHMAFYGRYHRDLRNRATHYVGVPMIAFSILIPMGLARFSLGGVEVSAAWGFALAVLAYYLGRDLTLGLVAAAIFVPLTYAADRLAQTSLGLSMGVFAGCFVGGWVLQLMGHAYEGRRPALVDNLFQVIIAPIFLIAEAIIALGLKRDLKSEVARLAAARPSGAAGTETSKGGR